MGAPAGAGGGGRVRARWVVDARFGGRGAAVGMLQEWARGPGRGAPAGGRLLAGHVGAPESRLELELEFASLADFEGFLQGVPGDEHRAWAERFQPLVEGGGARWEVWHQVPLEAPGGEAGPSGGSRPQAEGLGEGAVLEAGLEGVKWVARTDSGGDAPALLVPASETEEEGGAGAGAGADAAGGSPDGGGGAPKNVRLDWKGDPMVINPGDNLPGFM